MRKLINNMVGFITHYPKTAKMNPNTPRSVISPIFPAIKPLNLCSTDAEEMKEQSAMGSWSYDHKQYSRGKFQGGIFHTNTPRLQLSLTSRSSIVIRDGIPPGATVISMTVSTNKPAIYRGKPLENNHAICLKHNEEFEYLSSEPTKLLTIACSSKLIEQKALEETGKSFDVLRFNDQLEMKEDCFSKRVNHLLSLLHFYHYQTDGLCGEEGIFLENEVLETILGGVLARQDRQQDKSRYKHSLMQAKKAEHYIRANLNSNLSIYDICLATGTTERSLHLGFKERYGVSPSAYILIMKLNEARAELRRSGFHHSVTDIAMRWGFNHLGRFAEQYRRFFGELPSDTIKSKNR